MREYLANWAPRNAEERAYYSLVQESDARSSGVWVNFVEPLLNVLGLYTVADASYGRASLPLSPSERALRNKQGIEHREARVFITNPNEKGSVDFAKSAPRPLHSTTGEAWVSYSVWWDSTVKARKADIIYTHGINDYGGKFTRHAEMFLRAGYRIILPDLPSHGRSSGLHVYTLDVLADALHAVICDVLHHDTQEGLKGERKLFVCGQSMGGFSSIAYALRYPPDQPSASPYAIEKGFGPTPILSGMLVLCPMLAISPESRPAYLTELFARLVASFAGRMPLAPAHKGKDSQDPNVSEEFNHDPQGYHHNLRIATGLAILQAIVNCNERLSEIKIPFFIRHGSADRVTAVRGSQKLYDEAQSTDKSFKVLEGYEHVILREGRDREDDEQRQKVLREMLEWLNARTE